MMETPSTPPTQSITEKLRQMRVTYVASLPEKLQQMRQSWEAWRADPSSADAADTLYRTAHNLAGSGTTFGYPDISLSSRAIMVHVANCRDRNCLPSEIMVVTMQAAFAQLENAIRSCTAEAVDTDATLPAAPVAVAHAVPRSAKLVYLVDDDANFAQRLATKLQDYGFAIAQFPSVSAFEAALDEIVPDAVVMDMILPEGDLAGAEVVIKQLHGRLQATPVIFLSVREDLESRLSAVRAGAARYFTKPVDMPVLRQALQHLTKQHAEANYRVLLVDDDEELSRLYGAQMEAAGISVHMLHDPTQILRVLAADVPDLILLDVNMPAISGLEVGAVIRQIDAYLHIPIVFMTSDRDMEKRLVSMQLGGDDFLVKPVDPVFLVEVVRTRIDKSRQLRSGEQRIKVAIRELQNLKFAQDHHSIVSIADQQGNIIEVNSKFVEVSGYSREELLGRNHRVVKSGYHPESFYREMWHTIIQGKTWHGQIKNRKKDGSFYWVNATIAPILDDFGVPEKYISIRTDITQIKELEQFLLEGQERLNLALDATNTGFWEWDLEHSSTYYSERCRLLLGYDMDTPLSWPLLIHPDDYPAVSERLMAHLVGKTTVYSSDHRKKNGAGGWDWVYESGKVVGLDTEGEVVRMIGTMQIINERKAMEAMHQQMSQQLLQASKMEAMGHLTSGVAHDFNNILGGILGYIELSRALLKRESPNLEKLDRYLVETQTAGIRAKELVAQMLVFSRMAPEQGDDEVPVIVIKPILKEVINLLHSSIPATINLQFHLPEEDVRAAIQPVHLHQILLNLAINSRDAMGEYGLLDFTLAQRSVQQLHCASCDADVSGDYVDITVKDSGGGIPEDLQKKIFDPFFTTKEVGKGTGMGLSVVHGIVHQLGGHIQVESTEGVGTAIHILLPRPSDQGRHESAAASELNLNAPALANIRILVVDDEHTMASMITELLIMHGASVMTYTSSSEALKAFAHNPAAFDLVITDETMPELSGLDMARKMLQLHPGLPIILCTGYSERATPEIAAQEGVTAFMRKPLKIPTLLEAIQKFARRDVRHKFQDLSAQ